MDDDIQIRSVTVEMLRPGPAHNQLLSPLTQYLAICDDAEAGVVTQPYEHATFLERMKAMRYDDDRDEGARRGNLRELGVEAARLLGSIPRLPGTLTADPAGPPTLVHLRLVLTPSELASLPFELAKVPIGPNAFAEGWLSLQSRPPVVITRRTRNVSSIGVEWPLRPRVLFIAADPDDVPFAEHRDELLKALQPFLLPGRDDRKASPDDRREQFGALLTVLKDASYNEVLEECKQNNYTHIHILAHGTEDRTSQQGGYGLVLDDFIAADRLASAFCGLASGGIRRPSVVTLATCESGNPGSVLVPGGSIAHVLHQAGIPLVLASQVPLSKEGSVLLVREFYGGLLWGENPWVLMHRVRTMLHGLLGASSHDWASLVVYEALPPDLPTQLEETGYLQAKAANNVSFERVDRALQDSVGYAAATGTMFETLKRLPTEGRFAMEGLGLRASSFKRLAQAEFRIAQQPGCDSPVHHALESAKYLHEALHLYERAVSGFLVDTGKPVQRVASLHWVLVQQLCLSAVLRIEAPEGAEATARMSARAYLEHPDPREQAWARGSLAELELLALLRAPTDQSDRSAFQQSRKEAQTHVRELIRLARRLDDSFPVESTFKQFRRYVDWWGTLLLENVIKSLDLDDRGILEADRQQLWGKTEASWVADGVVGVAQELAVMLDEKGAADRTEHAARPYYSGPAGPAATSGKSGPESAPVQLRQESASTQQDSAATRVGSHLTGGQLGARKGARHSPELAREGPFITIEMLPAGHGDCLWIAYGEGDKTYRVLVDCGTPETFEPQLKPRIERVPQHERHFELFVMTHIDADHIGGGIPFVEAAETLGVTFGDVWFNGWAQIKEYGFLGAKQGEIFSALIVKHGWPWNKWQEGKAIVLEGDGLLTRALPGGMVLTLLSPTADKLRKLALKWKKEIKALGLEPGEGDKMLAKPTVSTSTDVPALAKEPFESDTAENNGSSITVLAEYGGKSVLLGADCHAPLLANSIKILLKQRGAPKLKIDAFKIPHHGSQNNLDETVMGQIDCSNYLISSNGKVFKHPDRQAIARTIYFGSGSPRLYFNYRTSINEVWGRPDLQEKYGYTAVYPEPGKEGLLVTLDNSGASMRPL